jgi:ABC-type multidrug transport system fused ATPase/permease subunit
VDADPLESARSYMGKKPGAKLMAVGLSVAAAVCLAGFLPVLYLFGDLLVWKGKGTSFADLSPNRKASFRERWDELSKSPQIAELNAKSEPNPNSNGESVWEQRWGFSTIAYLNSHTTILRDSEEATPPEGIVGPLVREHGRWTAVPLAVVAKYCPWTYRSNAGYLATLFVVGLALAAGFGIASAGAAHFAADTTLDGAARLRRAIYTHTNRIGAIALKKPAQDEVAELMTDKVATIQDGSTEWLQHAYRTPVLVVLVFAICVLIHPWVTLALACFGGLVWLVAGQASVVFRRDGRIAARRADARLGQMRESVAALHLVKTYQMERFAGTRVERILDEFAKADRRRQRGVAFGRPALWAVAAVAAVVMLAAGGRIVLTGDLSVAGFVTILAGLGLVVWPMRAWVRARRAARAAQGAAAAVVEFLHRRGDAGQSIDAEFLQPIQRKIEIVGVSLREQGTGRKILEDVSFAIPAGTRVAIVGTDPTGPLALAHLLTRFAEPTGGEVKADGKNLRWVTVESLRTQVAFVGQDRTVFTDTVANNIGCGDPGFSVPQIMEAAKIAHAHQFVQRLPYGYETRIGEHGHSLKPGEMFRIALARAILRDPSVLIIEEPAVPLDPDSADLVDDTFARIRKGRTVVVLPHREASARSADKVFVLHQGRLVAFGTHDELLESSEVYRRLQFKEIVTAA